MRAALLASLLVTAPALADEPPRSGMEAGTLGLGKLALRMDLGFAPNTIGLGGQVVVGLGPVDVAAGASLIPCTDIDTICPANVGFTSLAAQVGIATWDGGLRRLSARATADIGTRGWDAFHLVSGGLIMTGGFTRHRYVTELLVFAYRDEPSGHDNGVYVGGRFGYEYAGSPLGVRLLVGAAGGTAATTMPLVTLEALIQ